MSANLNQPLLSGRPPNLVELRAIYLEARAAEAEARDRAHGALLRLRDAQLAAIQALRLQAGEVVHAWRDDGPAEAYLGTFGFVGISYGRVPLLSVLDADGAPQPWHARVAATRLARVEPALAGIEAARA